MENKFLKVHPDDNVVVALQDLASGTALKLENQVITLLDDVKAKHKFLDQDLKKGDQVRMYGVLVAIANEDLKKGNVLTTKNVHHAASSFKVREHKYRWTQPDVKKWSDRKFMGYHRSDGNVGVANYWLVIPMVFCENRNVDVMREALLDQLGYQTHNKYNQFTRNLVDLYKAGRTVTEILEEEFENDKAGGHHPLFPNVDGIKFLTHQGGCGGIRQDAVTLCGLLAGYITHPNVAGATVLSLGCQNAQVDILQ
ncbi:MAG TPA: UxaA family hydrolase, partial [Arachidicoccus sp.]|nr:UxaA family hydrolase [Arachidicoccus sp.]